MAGAVSGAGGASRVPVWWLRGDLVVAGMHVNDWDAVDRVRALVGTRPGDDALCS